LGKGNGRVYTIAYTAADGHGGTCEGSVQVCVPHDRHHVACVDDGQTINSLGPCRDDGDGYGPGRKALADLSLTIHAVTGNDATLEYALPAGGDVRIGLFDIAGRRVAILQAGPQTAGAHSLSWDASRLARGMYFCRIQAGATTVTKTVAILK
jgi:hypothetical protein